MADRPAVKQIRHHTGRVLRTEPLTPHMTRVVLGGEGLREMSAGEHTDHYVKLLFPVPGITYPEPFDMGWIRAHLPRHEWPVTRTYTVRRWLPELPELTLDFVLHGDSGIAGPWARTVRPGEAIHMLGPGGGYSPAPESDWHLLAGDESALPAIAASLERMPAGATVHALIEVAGPEEEQPLDLPDGVRPVWLHRGTQRPGSRLTAAVRELQFPAGRVQAFVHGEAGFVKEIRHHLRRERGIPREQLSISGYWRLGHDEDGWRASKREWNAQVEAEQERRAA